MRAAIVTEAGGLIGPGPMSYLAMDGYDVVAVEALAIATTAPDTREG